MPLVVLVAVGGMCAIIFAIDLLVTHIINKHSEVSERSSVVSTFTAELAVTEKEKTEE